MRFPIGPVAQNGGERPCGAPVVVAGTGREFGGAVFQHPAQVFGLELIGLADAEPLGDERLHPGRTLDMRLDPARGPGLRASQQNRRSASAASEVGRHDLDPAVPEFLRDHRAGGRVALALFGRCGRSPVTTGAASPVSVQIPLAGISRPARRDSRGCRGRGGSPARHSIPSPWRWRPGRRSRAGRSDSGSRPVAHRWPAGASPAGARRPAPSAARSRPPLVPSCTLTRPSRSASRCQRSKVRLHRFFPAHSEIPRQLQHRRRPGHSCRPQGRRRLSDAIAVQRARRNGPHLRAFADDRGWRHAHPIIPRSAASVTFTVEIRFWPY